MEIKRQMLNIMGTFEIETVIGLNGNMSVILKEAISRKNKSRTANI